MGKATLTEALGSGESLPAAQKAQFEGSLGRDLSHVRVHTGDGAERLTSHYGARAFAVGGSIAFAKGEYDPDSREGKHLLAHEVAHAAQQGNAALAGDEARGGEGGAATMGGGRLTAGTGETAAAGESAGTGETATTGERAWTGDSASSEGAAIGLAGGLSTTQPGDAAEAGADAAADAMVEGKPAQVSAEPIAIARKGADEPRAPSAPAGEAKGDGAATEGKGGEEEIGELTADRVGQEPYEELVAPIVPPHDLEGGKQDLAGAGQRTGGDVAADGAPGAALPGEQSQAPGAEGDGGGVAQGAAGGGAAGGEGGEGGGAAQGGGGVVPPALLASIAEAQSDAREAGAAAEAESTAFKADMDERRERFDAEQQALTIEQLKTMSATDKRATLADLGYDPKKVAQLKDTELDGIITDKLDAERNKTKILGMSPEELAKLSPAQKQKFLVDLGIDREDLEKAGQAKTDKLFADVTRAAHIPGQHKVKIEIKGGLFGKSWVVTVTCSADGGVDAQAHKEGGFLSKLVGWIKAALPILLTVIAPLTGGASLIALSVYQTVMAIKTGNWLGAITGAAGALVGLGAIKAIAQGTGGLAQALQKVAGVADKVKSVATAAQTAMAAAKAKHAGSLLAALSSGAALFAGFASNAAGKFATTMTKWSERLEKWSIAVGSGEKLIKAIEGGDVAGAIGAAFSTAGAIAGTGTKTGKALERASNITACVDAGRRALQTSPPNYAAVADAALGIAAQLTQNRKVEDAQRLVSSANRLKAAWDARASNPAGVAEAALALAEAIQLAKYDLENDEDKDGEGKPDAGREAIIARYQRSTRVVKSAGALLAAASARPHPNYTAALDAAAQLVAEFTEDKRLDAAAVVTSKLDAWTKAVNKGDQQGIIAASLALFQSVDGLRDAIDEERDKSKQEAEAQLPAGEKLPDDGGGVPRLPAPPAEPVPVGPGDIQVPTQSSLAGSGPSSGSESGQDGQAGQTGQTPGQTAGPPAQSPSAAAPAELPEDAKTIIAVIKIFADLAAQFEHPTAKKLIGEWEDIREQAEALGTKDASAYEKVLASLRLIKSTAAFHEVVAKEFSTWSGKLDPLEEAATRRELQAFGRFKRNLERLVRAAAIPETFMKAADDVVVACGFDKDLSGEPSTMTERLVAAANLVQRGATLHGDLAWLARVGQAVTTRLGGATATAAISAVRGAANKLDAKVAGIIMRWVTPILEKIAATSGGRIAAEVGQKLVVVLGEWGVSLTRVTSSTAFRGLASTLGSRLGLALRFSVSLPVAIAIEIGKLEMQFADQLFAETYANVSRWVSARLFGKTIDELKREIQTKSDASFAACDALFRWAFRGFLSGATSQVSRGWLPYLVQRLPGRSMGLPAQFGSAPEHTLLTLDPPDLKLIAAGAIKDLANEYLDQEYRREFGENP